MLQVIKVFLISMPLLSMISCSGNKAFTLKKVGNELILNGRVPVKVLENKEKYPWFYYGFQAYKPNADLINKLKPVSKDISVLVIGGSWCSDTQLELPKFYKVAEQMGMVPEQIELLMADRKKICNSLNIKVIHVKKVPSFLFYKDGKELGRIVEKPDSSFEFHLCRIFNLM